MPDPLLSIVMPVRDAARTLPEALASVLAEPLDALEVVAVDDGSADGSAAMLESARDPRLRVVRQERLGLVAALNRGLAEARGEFIGRMDADDVSVPGRFRDQVGLLRGRPDVDLVAARCRVFRDDGPPGAGMRHWAAWSNRMSSHEAMARQRFVESPFAHPAVVARARMLREAGGYRDGDFPEDYELWLRLFDSGALFARLPRVGVHVREHPGRSIHRDPRYRPEAFLRLKLTHLRRGVLRPGEPVVVFGGGRAAKAWLRELVAAGVPVAALADLDPRRIGMRIDGVPVVEAGEAARGGRFGELLGLGALGKPAGRRELRRRLPGLGRAEGEDFYFVA